LFVEPVTSALPNNQLKFPKHYKIKAEDKKSVRSKYGKIYAVFLAKPEAYNGEQLLKDFFENVKDETPTSVEMNFLHKS